MLHIMAFLRAWKVYKVCIIVCCNTNSCAHKRCTIPYSEQCTILHREHMAQWCVATHKGVCIHIDMAVLDQDPYDITVSGSCCIVQGVLAILMRVRHDFKLIIHHIQHFNQAAQQCCCRRDCVCTKTASIHQFTSLWSSLLPSLVLKDLTQSTKMKVASECHSVVGADMWVWDVELDEEVTSKGTEHTMNVLRRIEGWKVRKGRRK